jgi:hypothetical protein
VKGHKTVRVSIGTVNIDEKLAPLIPLLWAQGIRTCQCCQEERPGKASITFADLDNALKFLNVAQREYPVVVETRDDGEGGELHMVGRLLVLFPADDIPQLIEAFTTTTEDEDEEEDAHQPPGTH